MLVEDGVEMAGPVEGAVASGDVGLGRMIEPEDVVQRIVARLGGGELAGVRLVVTAGPTVEDIDPVRFIGNRSSGKMGFALAGRAAMRGAAVTLVAGPVALETPPGVRRVDVRSALDLKRELLAALGPDLSAADALLMCAAVGDFRAEHVATDKLKRGTAGLTLRLVQNPDVLSEIGAMRRGKRPVLVGFAVETGTDTEIVARAREKLRKKRVDVVVANHAAESMGRDDNRVLLVGEGFADALPALPKAQVADRIVDWLATQLSNTVVTRATRGARHSDAAPRRRKKPRRR